MDQTTTSITLNDISGSLSEIYVKLTDMGMQIDATNMAMAGIQKEIVGLIDQSLINNRGILLPVQSNIGQTGITPVNSLGNNNQPVYFSNTTNVYWNGAKNNNNTQNLDATQLSNIEADLQTIIGIMKDCGCGGKSDVGINDEGGEKKEGYQAVGNAANGIISGKPDKVSEAISSLGIAAFWRVADHHDIYANATPDEKFKLDKNSALENVKELNDFWNFLSLKMPEAFRTPEDEKLDIFGQNSYVTISEGETIGTLHTTLTDLVRKYPQILQDQKYINEIRRLLDIKGDKDLINQAKELGFLTTQEKQIFNNFKMEHPAAVQAMEKFIKTINTSSRPSSIHNSPEKDKLYVNPENGFNLAFPKIDTPEIRFDTFGRPVTMPHTQIKGKDNNTVINIKVEGLVKQFTVNTTTMQESAGQIRDMVSQVLMGAVKDSVLVAKA